MHRLSVDAAHGVLANDTSPAGVGKPVVTSFFDALHGHVDLSPDGSFTYTPDGTFDGTDTFTYEATAGNEISSDTTVSIRVHPYIELVSSDSSGVSETIGSANPAISPDGNEIAFSSLSSNLVPGDTNHGHDIFVKNLLNGAIQRVSTRADGVQAIYASDDGSGSFGPAFSPDGKELAFSTTAIDLVPSDANYPNVDIVIKDLGPAGGVQLVSAAADGTQAKGNSYDPVFSPDGTRIAFYSSASNLVAGDTNNDYDVFIKNLQSQNVQLLSEGMGGTPANGNSYHPTFSPDGSKVAFESSATNLVPDDLTGSNDIFVEDPTTRAIQLVSTAADGTRANNNSANPVFSPDGTKVAFVSHATNLVPGDTNGFVDVFVKDLKTGAIQRVSTAADGTQENGNADDTSKPVFSPDGTKIAFASNASNLVAGDTNGIEDIFVKDLTTGAIERVSTAAGGVQAEGTEGFTLTNEPVFSSDGTELAFTSGALNLVPGTDPNSANRIFVKYLLNPSATQSTNQGQLADGYITGADVSIDANGNGALDGGEPSSITDADGRFTLPPQAGVLVATGGVDIATRLHVQARLSAPSGSSDITPLTTLIVALQSMGMTDAQAKVLSIFGLDPTTDLTTLDPVSATSNRDAQGSAAFLAGTQVMDTLSDVAAFLGGAEGQPAPLYTDALNAIAAVVGGSGSLDLTNTATITAIIDAGLHGSPARGDVVSGAATIIAALNSAAAADAGLTGTDALVGLSAVALTAQGMVSQALQAAALDPSKVPAALQAYTGIPLAQTIQANEFHLGDVDGPEKNNAPIAAADSYSATQHTPLVITAALGVLLNDRDPDADQLTATLSAGPQHGNLVLNGDGSFTYTGNAGYLGTDSFSYQASDGTLSSAPVTVTLDVVAPHATPVAEDDNFTITENSALRFLPSDLLANDQNVEPDASVTVETDPSPLHGAISGTQDGHFLYTPNPGFSGTDSFRYFVENGTVQSNYATVDVTVNSTDTTPIPVAEPDSFTLKENGSLTFTAQDLLANDEHTEADSNVDVLTDPGPAHGVISAAPDGTSFLYTPDAGYIGPDDFSYQVFNGSVAGNLADVSLQITGIACFVRGTRLATERGEVAVEDLAIGDRVTTWQGGDEPIRWIGRRSYAGRFLAANPAVQPIRLRAGCLGAGLPWRDLLVSPEHAMFLDGALIPARHLTNGVTIHCERVLDQVDYFHIELDSHGIVLAEGAPSETFVDDDSRGIFHNAAEHAALYPGELSPGRFCAPRVTDGYEIEAIRQRLAVVAGEVAQAA